MSRRACQKHADVRKIGSRAKNIGLAVLTLLSVSEENFPKNLQLVDTIAEIANKKKVTSAQLTLAWLLAQGDDIFPVGAPLLLSVYLSALQSASLTRPYRSVASLLTQRLTSY